MEYLENRLINDTDMNENHALLAIVCRQVYSYFNGQLICYVNLFEMIQLKK